MEEIQHELKQFDNISETLPKHKTKSSTDDELYTPDEVYYEQTKHYNIVCELDPFAKEWIENDVVKSNSKCLEYFTIKDNGLFQQWLLPDGTRPTGVWVNHPHSLHKEVLKKALEQWQEHDLDIIMIIPSNTVRPPYWSYYVNRFLNKGLIVEPLESRTEPYKKDEEGNPIYNKKGDMLGKGGYINFKKRDQTDTEFDSRNGYVIIRYFSKKSWTEFIKSRLLEMNSYGN